MREGFMREGFMREGFMREGFMRPELPRPGCAPGHASGLGRGGGRNRFRLLAPSALLAVI